MSNDVAKAFLTLLAAAMLAGSSQTAEAQRPAHYYPARPSFSPYLLYRQFNTTNIPNYYTYVQPARTAIRQSQVQAWEAPRIQRQQTLIRQQQVNEIIDGRLGQRISTGIGQPAVPATFMDTSHYYRFPTRRR